MVKIAVSIETKDRRLPDAAGRTGDTNYLGTTLRNFAEVGGFDSPYLHSLQVVCGGPEGSDKEFFDAELWPNLPPAKAPVIVHPACGRRRQLNGATAIQVAAQTDADFVLKLEDDLDFVGDFMGSVGRFLAEHGQKAPMITFASTWCELEQCHYQPGENITGPGTSFARVRQMMAKHLEFVTRPAACGFWGALALAWKREQAQQGVEWLGPDPCLVVEGIPMRDNAHDLLLGVWANSLGPETDIGFSLPSFVQHLGFKSSIARDRRLPIQFPWPGRAWKY